MAQFSRLSESIMYLQLEIEDTSHYLLHCHHFSHHRVDLINSVKSVCDNFESMPDNIKKDLLSFGDSRFDENKNKVILEATINYLKNLKDFLVPFLSNVLLLNDVHLKPIIGPLSYYSFLFLILFEFSILISPRLHSILSSGHCCMCFLLFTLSLYLKVNFGKTL